ncbi:unnamed protein product [Symbiodinium natans]|uniref:RAP domain-containing protein n=1 Tax=Symbiodinium natans TaxID=878477 RepID=A0A812GPT5_9DINO|nr:unnamed protein product [Symbiodinium natans]
MPPEATASAAWQPQEAFSFSCFPFTVTGPSCVADVQAVLRQVVETGNLQEDLLWRLRGRQGLQAELAKAVGAKAAEAEEAEEVKAESQKGESAVEEMEEDSENPEDSEASEKSEMEVALAESAPVPCTATDLVATAELCMAWGLRDFSDLVKLGDRLGSVQASASELLRAGVAFSHLGVLHPPLFQGIAQALLLAWPDPFSTSDAAHLAQVFATQRFRHAKIFAQIAVCLRGGMDSMSKEEALSLLYSHAFLRLWPSEHSDMSEELWQALEEQASPSQPEGLLKLCHVQFLAQRDEVALPKVLELLERASPQLLQRPVPWQPSLRRRVLLIRSALRYLHREAYTTLPKDVQQMFRRAHRMEPDPPPKYTVLFVRKLSQALTKLKIGHVAKAVRGPFIFDIVERDRKIIYECNHFDRFYMNSTEKIASMRLQERVVKAMGYRVVQVPHWHWNKIKHRRQRIEYIRMSRYYALKDRRELAPRDAPVSDLAENELDYLGEYFFKKDMPSSPWSWFQPRYDASKRIPEPRTGTL